MQLGVVVNSADPQSVAVGEYYLRRRGIPSANLIRLSFRPDRNAMGREEFIELRRQLTALTPAGVQAYAITWLRPYRVDCMSITSAVAFGFDPRYCSDRCEPTRRSLYFDSSTSVPYDRFGDRPAMIIAARNLIQARALIDRGIASDGTRPGGTAYLVRTRDARRNVRSAGYAKATLLQGARIRVEQVDRDVLHGRQDVMFYFIGGTTVPDIGSNHFLPGAVADHLTSLGGDLLGLLQMSSLQWLEAGATGSYGTVVEPCNFIGKFPDPAIMMQHYLAGETLIEAYWKSVAMPGQGLFIGEPLARPFGSGL
jgi:uncharacterized protein (TIGR03790 family)